MKSLIVGFTAGVFMLAGAVAWGNPVIEVSVATDQSSYQLFEPIEMSVIATNPGDFDITLQFNSGFQAGYVIDGTYNPAAYWYYIQAFTSVFIPAHQSHTWTFDYDWDDHFLAPGTHSLEGYVFFHDQSPLIEFEIVHEPGDCNFDGKVDVTDLGILATNYGATCSKWRKGDADGDGDVDVEDLGVLASAYGYDKDATAAVPEPGTIALVCAGVLLLVIRRRLLLTPASPIAFPYRTSLLCSRGGR